MRVNSALRFSLFKLFAKSVDFVYIFLLVTQHYDAVQDAARNSNSNTAMMNYSPSGIGDVATQIREAMLSVTPVAGERRSG